MVRTWLKSYYGRPFRPTKVDRSKRVRMGLESLEQRLVLSTYSLDSLGNLSRITGSQQLLIDTGVQKFTAVNNKVYDLHAYGLLEAMNSDGSAKTNLDTGVLEFAVGSLGDVYTLNGSGSLKLNGVVSWANTRDFALAPDGTLYWLGTADSGGWLQKKAPGSSTWVNVAPNTSKFTIASDGTCYSLMSTNSTLYVNGRAVWANTADFGLAPDGTLYWLGTPASGGWLQKEARGSSTWVNVAPNTSKFSIASDGTCYSLMSTNSTLYVNGRWAWSNTADFALAPDGTLYWLETAAAGGWLQSKAPGSSTWVNVAPNTSKFLIASDGTCYSLMSTNNTLYVNGHSAWGNTADFALAPGGTLYWLGTAAAGWWLQIKAPGSSTWVNVAPNTSKFLIASDGTCYSLMSTNNTLYVNGHGAWGNTADFTLAPDGTLYWLGTAASGGWLQK